MAVARDFHPDFPVSDADMKFSVNIITAFVKLVNTILTNAESFICFYFFRSHLWQRDIPRLWVKSLHLLVYATVTAIRDLNFVCDSHHSSRQHQLPNSLSEARDQTHNLVVPCRIRFRCTTPRNSPRLTFLIWF